MVTVDAVLRVCFWEHASAMLTGFGWFRPRREVLLDPGQRLCRPVGPRSTLFTDTPPRVKVRYRRFYAAFAC